jgi:hypothetical protein
MALRPTDLSARSGRGNRSSGDAGQKCQRAVAGLECREINALVRLVLRFGRSPEFSAYFEATSDQSDTS